MVASSKRRRGMPESRPVAPYCRDSETATESPRLRRKRSKLAPGGSANPTCSEPGSSQPTRTVFLGSRRPKTRTTISPSNAQPIRTRSASGILRALRRSCRSSSRCSKCIRMQKWPKYSADAADLSCVTSLPLKAATSTFDSILCASSDWRRLADRCLPPEPPPASHCTACRASGSFDDFWRMNQPSNGGQFFDSRAFQARASPPQVPRLKNHPDLPFLASFL
mmetsp:Transcript_67873/g.209856  ORF Transcript_67873/g.209856 Transcript_67873/m.209856 type:complete len:223 (-) Transcript_67873:505-1173(-)